LFSYVAFSYSIMILFMIIAVYSYDGGNWRNEYSATATVAVVVAAVLLLLLLQLL